MAAISTAKSVKHWLVGAVSYADFTTIGAALAALDGTPTEITILQGHYSENLKLYRPNVTLRGLGEVVITGNHYALAKDDNGQEIGTFQTATFFINTHHVRLENITIENTAGPGTKVGQAVALYTEGDEITVKNCRLLAHQDTLCVGPLPAKNKSGAPLITPWKKQTFTQNRVSFHGCFITGTIDFIFGGGTATFQQCELVSRKKAGTEPNFLTAPSTLADAAGFSFLNCWIHGDQPYYLGRPWRPHGASHFENCFFDEQLHSAGWDEWGKASNRLTARFSEKNNHYPGPVDRAPWIDWNKERRTKHES